MDDLKKNKFAVGAIAAAVVGIATVYYVYNKNNRDNAGSNQRTFAFIKPDAFKNADEIMKDILEAGFTIVKSRRITLTQEQAELFYYEHKGKPFFGELVDHMTSGSILIYIILIILIVHARN